jgi:sigma-B regulation protein RsbU (phosphoserine phosphatase)
MTRLHGEVINLGRDLDRRNRELQRALDEIKALKGILPICMFCKRIRDDDGNWQQLEKYISARTEAEFSHGLCIECEKKQWPEGGS